MSQTQNGQRLRQLTVRFGGEALLIVVSVFVAILLESQWQDHREAKEARESLAQVRLSLQEDKRFFDQVEAEQNRAAEQSRRLIQWFASPETIPTEEAHEVLETFTMPISIWPRRAAWNTMVNSGQLRLLNAPQLVTRIGDYYEHHLRRMEYNGQQYDAAFTAVAEGSLREIWNFEKRELLITDPVRLTQFRNQLLNVDDWIVYYLEAAERNRSLAESLIEEIDTFLE
ncbi:MAG: DUF6090 family protein [Pseudomonadota bacterium]